MRTQNIIAIVVVVFLFGGVAGYLFHPYMNPPPPIPPPELIPGEPVIVYKDTTLYDTVYAEKPIEVILEPEPDTEYSTFEKDIELFDSLVTFTISGRAIDLKDFRITNAKLHLQETQITITDTLRVPFPVYIEKKIPWWKIDTKSYIAGIITVIAIMIGVL